MKWGQLLHKGGGLIQMDIGDHPPIPLEHPPLFLSFSLIVAQHTIFGIFSGPKFRSHFEGLKDIFLGNPGERKNKISIWPFFLSSLGDI